MLFGCLAKYHKAVWDQTTSWLPIVRDPNTAASFKPTAGDKVSSNLEQVEDSQGNKFKDWRKEDKAQRHELG